MPKLTKRIVDAAEVTGKQYYIWCSELPGFGVRVNPSGKRTYYADYRNSEGARKRMAIGQHGKLTTEEARKQALLVLAAAVKGDDLLEEKRTRRKSITMADLCDAYLEAADNGLIFGKRGTPKKASTLATDRGRIERHIKPLLGKKLVKDLVQADINRFMRDIAKGKTAKVEKSSKLRGKTVVTGGAGTASRTVGLLGGILTYAVSEGIISASPVHGVKRPSDNRRDRRLTDDEYRALGGALKSLIDEGERAQAIHAVWLLALTGCRRGEIINLRWSEVDTEGHALRLEDSKTGASVRPIGQAVLDVLDGIEKEDNPFVLTGIRGDGPFNGFPNAWKRICVRAGLEGVTAHTLRHSFASVAGDMGYSEHTIAAMLGHSTGSITSRYVHHLDEVLIAAADKVASAVYSRMIELGDRQ